MGLSVRHVWSANQSLSYVVNDYPTPISLVTPSSFDFPLELVNPDAEVLEGVVDLMGANEDL